MGETESKSANGAIHATSTSDSSTVATGQDDQPPIAEPPDLLAIEKPILPHTLSAHRVARDLKSDVDDGLSSEEAAARLARDGPNSIKGAKGISLYEIFIQQIANALTVVLIAVTALSFAISDYIEGGVVAAVIVLNIVVGYVFAASLAQPICWSCRLLLLQLPTSLLHFATSSRSCSLFLLPYGEACDFAMRKARSPKH
uniref:Cation-transporting P-type ATPase N-terminal domain-containing protein n=1 Tax=Fusarium oxysporum (strain Fo5176) TaxID=660025 RepID=A0A0D2XYU8_FUSOF